MARNAADEASERILVAADVMPVLSNSTSVGAPYAGDGDKGFILSDAKTAADQGR